MHGQKTYTEKLFTHFQLSDRIPEENFYRRLKASLDLNFLRALTAPYYGDCGQKSLDPVVFMKLMLVGYLENLCSDRKLMAHCAMRLDILYFLDYDIDEPLPWHSTLSRTRALLPEELFTKVFDTVFKMCVNSGMVSGHSQAIDSAPIKANASMDSVELKVPASELSEHLAKVRAFSEVDKLPSRPAKTNRADKATQEVSANKQELQEIANRNHRWQTTQTERPGAKDPRSKYTSNKTHYSPVDPDARISVKPGKARKLNYHAQMAVDTAHHVISHIAADYADKKDSQSLQAITAQLKQRLNKEQLLWHNVLADAGYSSGENYAYLEAKGLTSYIPPHGTYKGGPSGFTYHKTGDYWTCQNNKQVTFRKVFEEKGTKKRRYLTTRKDCKDCPFRKDCIGKSHEKRIDITYYNEEYQRAIARVQSKQGRRFKYKRSSTVEPVFGTLTQYVGLRKINTRGISNATKVMLCAAMAYNLKKYLKFTRKKAATGVGALQNTFSQLLFTITALLSAEPSFKM